MGKGPNAFPVEMASGNGRTGGTGVLQGGLGRGGDRFGEREKHGGGMGALGKMTPTLCLSIE
jgi:hypothetical protein